MITRRMMPLLIGVFACTAGLLCRCCWASTTSPTGLPWPPTGVSASTAGHLCCRCWASTTSLRSASVAADWCLRLHGWPIMPPLLGVYVFTDRLAFAATDWCFRLHSWPTMPPLLGVYVLTTIHGCPRLHRPACLCCRRLVSLPTQLAYYAAVVGRLRLHRRPTSVAADWCPRLYGWLATPPFMGVHVFTDRLAFAAADWCPCLHGWSIMPPLVGIFAFTVDRLPRRRLVSSLLLMDDLVSTSATSAVIKGNIAKIQIQIFIKGIHGFKLISYALGMDQLEHHHRLAFAATDWCLRLHGWHIMPPLLGAVVFTDRPSRPPPTGVFTYTVGWSHHRC
ncbi:uncharacterized protein LOC127782925 [Oryza glaberrima]|uniref:uncharacterized protein LOC127782925 n=1 Tax=Oryza glaberrima TaxID=4538 RepID=UPI00224C029D|nr:uncharacterized protein LOC127782925 [Oryza glaberrima]